MNKILVKTFDSSINVSNGAVAYLGKNIISFYSNDTNTSRNIEDLNWETNESWQANGDNSKLEIRIKKYFIQINAFGFKTPLNICYQTKFSIYGFDRYESRFDIGTYVSSEYSFCSNASSVPTKCEGVKTVIIPALSNNDVLFKKIIIESLNGSCNKHKHFFFFFLEG